MIKYTYNKVSALKHLAAALFLVVAGTANANEIQIDKIFIDNGETQTVNVNFEKTSTVVALQVYLTFPSGVKYEESTVTRNADRLDRDSHGLQSNLVENKDGSKTLRVVITPNNGDDEIQGTSGTLFSFQITATSDIDADVMKVTKIEASEIVTNDEGQRKLQALQLDGFDVEVSSKTSIRVLEVSPAAMTIEEGEANKQKVTIGLTNGFDVYGMQGTIVLPEGMSIETKENGKPKFSYGSRLPEAFSISSNVVDNKVKFVVSSRESAKFTGNEGEVLSFNVIADDALAETSQILIEDGVVSNKSAKSLSIDDKAIEVTNKTATVRRISNEAYAVLDAQLKGVEDKYNAAVDSIKGYATVEGKACAEGEEAKAIAEALSSAREALDAANAAYSLKDTVALAAEYSALDAKVDTLLATAQAVEDAAVAVNDEVYAIVDSLMKDVQAQYDSLLNVIKSYTSDEAKALAEGEQSKAVADSIAAVRTALDAANEAKTLRDNEAYATQIAGLTDSISALATLASQTEEEFKVIMGDVNGDKTVDVTDVTALISYALEEEVEVFNEKAADMNEDGEYDVTDVLMIIDLVLSAEVGE